MKNSVSMCVICRNEELNIAGLMDDVCPVLEEIHVTDTGSTDNTLKILAEKQKQYPNIFIHHYVWNSHFSDARNYSFSNAGNTEWVFWLDCDDRIDSEKLKHFKDNVLGSRDDIDCWNLSYIYSKTAEGSPNVVLSRERFLRRAKDPKWCGAIHEFIATGHLKRETYEGVSVEHNRGNKVMEDKRNIKILAKECENDPSEPRNAYYYGKELFDWGDPAAKEQLIHFLNLPCWRYWDDEIGARFRLAQIYLNEKKWDDALITIEPVYRLDNTRRRAEYYYIFGESEYLQKRPEIAVEWFTRCLCTPPGAPRTIRLAYWGENPLVRITECLRDLGRWDEVFAYIPSLLACKTARARHWISTLLNYIPHSKDGGEVVLEFGTNILKNSIKVNEEPYKVNAKGFVTFEVKHWRMTKSTPFVNACVDGVIIDPSKYPEMDINNLCAIIKPTGYLQSTSQINDPWLMLESRGELFKYSVLTFRGV